MIPHILGTYQRLSRQHIFTSWSRAWLQRKMETKIRSQCHPMDIIKPKMFHSQTMHASTSFSHLSLVFHDMRVFCSGLPVKSSPKTLNAAGKIDCFWVHCHSTPRTRLGSAQEGPRPPTEQQGLGTITKPTGRVESREKVEHRAQHLLFLPPPQRQGTGKKSRAAVENQIPPPGGPSCPRSGFSLGI